jgi:cob(I)alamin adenosyltransferase
MLYTGHGDGGYTRVIGGSPLPKSDARLEAIGSLDEAQAHLGLARALLTGSPWTASIQRVQADLRLLMADIATVAGNNGAGYLTERQLSSLEDDLRGWDAQTGGFAGFTTPGNTVPGAHLHLARTVIRRAERKIVALAQAGSAVQQLTLTYLNRLSSWVYALCLLVDSPTPAEAVA